MKEKKYVFSQNDFDVFLRMLERHTDLRIACLFCPRDLEQRRDLVDEKKISSQLISKFIEEHMKVK